MNTEIATTAPAYLAKVNPLDNECPVRMEDVKVPSLVICQQNSKALLEGEDAYIEGLKAGQMYNSVTREVYGKTIKAIFCDYLKLYMVFSGNSANPEYKETLSEKEFKQLNNLNFDKVSGWMSPDKDGCYIKETWRFVLVLPEDDSFDFIFLNFKPGGISDAKTWLNKMFAMNAKGTNVYAVIWEIPLYLKESKTSTNKSFQVDASKLVNLGFCNEAQYTKVMTIRQQIKETRDTLHVGSGEDY